METESPLLLADMLRHKLHAEDDFVAISIDTSSLVPQLTISGEYPKVLGGNTIILSKYAFGQWLANTDDQIRQDITQMIADSMATYSSMRDSILGCFDPVTGYSVRALTKLDTETHTDKMMNDALSEVFKGVPFSEVFNAQRFKERCAEVKTGGLAGSDDEALESFFSRIGQELSGNLDDYFQHFPGLLDSMVAHVREQEQALVSAEFPKMDDMAYEITEIMPVETEILLRIFPQPTSLGGSMFFVKDPDAFIAERDAYWAEMWRDDEEEEIEEAAEVSAEVSEETGEQQDQEAEFINLGKHIPFDHTMLVSSSQEHEEGSDVPEWKATGLHELTHFTDDLLQSRGFIGTLSDDAISDEESQTIIGELEASIKEIEESDSISDEFLDALFPDGVDHLSQDDIDTRLKQILDNVSASFKVYLEDEDYKENVGDDEDEDEHRSKTEAWARGIEVIHILTLDIRALDPAVLPEEAAEHARDALRLFSSTLDESLYRYEDARDNLLSDLRKRHGKLQSQINYDNMPEGMWIPDAAHVNGSGQAVITGRPGIEEPVLEGRVR